MKLSSNLRQGLKLGGAFVLCLHLATWLAAIVTVELFEHETAAVFTIPLLWLIAIPVYFIFRAKSERTMHYWVTSLIGNILLSAAAFGLLGLLSDTGLLFATPYDELQVLYVLIAYGLFAVGIGLALLDLVCRAIGALGRCLTRKYGEF